MIVMINSIVLFGLTQIVSGILDDTIIGTTYINKAYTAVNTSAGTINCFIEVTRYYNGQPRDVFWAFNVVGFCFVDVKSLSTI